MGLWRTLDQACAVLCEGGYPDRWSWTPRQIFNRLSVLRLPRRISKTAGRARVASTVGAGVEFIGMPDDEWARISTAQNHLVPRVVAASPAS